MESGKLRSIPHSLSAPLAVSGKTIFLNPHTPVCLFTGCFIIELVYLLLVSIAFLISFIKIISVDHLNIFIISSSGLRFL